MVSEATRNSHRDHKFNFLGKHAPHPCYHTLEFPPVRKDLVSIHDYDVQGSDELGLMAICLLEHLAELI